MIKLLHNTLHSTRFQVENSVRLISSQLFNQNQVLGFGLIHNYPIREFSNCHRASITRINRQQYLNQYPTVCVNPDGSTFTVRYPLPRRIIKLPVDITLLSESARNARLDRRKQKTKVRLDEEFEDESFDAKKYLKFVKK